MTAARIDWDRVTPPLARYLTYVASYDERYAAWRSLPKWRRAITKRPLPCPPPGRNHHEERLLANYEQLLRCR
jgi:hypothetical protein